MCSQFAGRFGLEGFLGGGCSSAVEGATRDSNSDSPTCIGGRLAIRVGWSPGLGGLHALGDSRWCMGGKAGDDGDVLGRRRWVESSDLCSDPPVVTLDGAGGLCGPGVYSPVTLTFVFIYITAPPPPRCW